MWPPHSAADYRSSMPTLPDGIVLPDVISIVGAAGPCQGEIVPLDRPVAKGITRTWWQAVANAPKELLRDEADRGWDWADDVGVLRHHAGHFGHAWAVRVDGRIEGGILYRVAAVSKVPPGEPVLFVARLATAPWNRPHLGRPNPTRGVGVGLLRLALLHSFRYGYAGRVELEARHGGPEAEWYRRRGFQTVGPPVDTMCDMVLGSEAAGEHLARMGVTT